MHWCFFLKPLLPGLLRDHFADPEARLVSAETAEHE